jgi:hypothetical protein
MKFPGPILRRFERRRSGNEPDVRVPDGMAREEFEAALADLPSDIDPDELREFVEASGEPACPVFKERLRALLWGWTRHGHPTASARRARHHLN